MPEATKHAQELMCFFFHIAFPLVPLNLGHTLNIYLQCVTTWERDWPHCSGSLLLNTSMPSTSTTASRKRLENLCTSSQT